MSAGRGGGDDTPQTRRLFVSCRDDGDVCGIMAAAGFKGKPTSLASSRPIKLRSRRVKRAAASGVAR